MRELQNSARLSLRRNERGIVIPLAAILITMLIFLLALAVDGYRILAADLQQHNNAEYGSEAAAKEFFLNSGSLDSAKAKAENLAVQNIYMGTGDAPPIDLEDVDAIALYPATGTQGTLTPGCWDPNASTPVFTPVQLSGASYFASLSCGGATKPALKLALNTTAGKGVGMLFARMLGMTEANLGANALAYIDSSLSLSYPIIVTHEE